MKLIALYNQPFAVVKDQGFIEIIAHFEPQNLLPSRKYFAEATLPEVYDKLILGPIKKIECSMSYFFYYQHLDKLAQQHLIYIDDSTLANK